MTTIRVEIPGHLRTLAGTGKELRVEVDGPVTSRSVLEALEYLLPVLRGTIRDHVTGKRRPYIRYYACGEDLSHQGDDVELPAAIVSGREAFIVMGAISGG